MTKICMVCKQNIFFFSFFFAHEQTRTIKEVFFNRQRSLCKNLESVGFAQQHGLLSWRSPIFKVLVSSNYQASALLTESNRTAHGARSAFCCIIKFSPGQGLETSLFKTCTQDQFCSETPTVWFVCWTALKNKNKQTKKTH